MNRKILFDERNFFTIWTTTSFSRTLDHGRNQNSYQLGSVRRPHTNETRLLMSVTSRTPNGRKRCAWRRRWHVWGRFQGLITVIRRGVGLHFDDAGHTIWASRRIMHLDGVICYGDDRVVHVRVTLSKFAQHAAVGLLIVTTTLIGNFTFAWNFVDFSQPDSLVEITAIWTNYENYKYKCLKLVIYLLQQ